MIGSCTLRMIVSFFLVLGFVWGVPGTINAQENKKKISPSTPMLQEAPIEIQEFEKRGAPGFMPLDKIALKKVIIHNKVKPIEIIKGDHVANGVGLRNRGGGKINLRGIPVMATLNKAYLYWCILGNEPVRNPTVSVNGVAVNGTLAGTGVAPCWSVKNSYIYQATVPNYLLYMGGNGDYEISGVPSSQGYGMSPWENNSGAYYAEGATLVIFFTTKSSIQKVTYLYGAPISGAMFSSGFSSDLIGFVANTSRAKFTMIGADGQTGNGVQSSYGCTKEESYFQGIQIAGPSSNPSALHDADSDWNGHDGEPLNQLWDTRTHMVPIKLRSTSATVKYQSYGDCLVICAFILTL